MDSSMKCTVTSGQNEEERLYWMLASVENRRGVAWTRFLVLSTRRAAELCTFWRVLGAACQQGVEVIKPKTNAHKCW